MLIAHLCFFRERKKLPPSIWSDLNIKEVESLPHDIDGHSAFKLKYDSNNLMKSTKDGRPWQPWVMSSRAGFLGIHRLASCGGTYKCQNKKCAFLHSYGKTNMVQFKSVTANCTVCACCGYEAVGVPCTAKKVWEFGENHVTVFHHGQHTCEARTIEPDISSDASAFFQANTNAKPSQYPFERLRGMLKEGKTVAEVHDSASAMADLKKIQNIKQKVISAVNPVGHSFEALAKIKEASDLKDKYLLWKVQDGRLCESKTSVVFRSSKERLDTAVFMQCGGQHPL